MGHCPTTLELSIKTVWKILHDYAGIAILHLEIINGSNILMGKISSEPCLLSKGIEVCGFLGCELMHDLYGDIAT